MEQDFLIKLQAKLDEAKAKTGITEDIKKIQNQIDSLKLQVSIDEKSIQNVMRQLDSVLNQKNVGSNIGDGIQKSVEASLQNVRKLISDTFKNLPKLNASDLISKFNLNSKDIDAGVVIKVRNITQELNKLASEAVKTNSDSSWSGVIKNIVELGNTLNQFGKVKADTSQYEHILRIAEELKKTKIYVDPSIKKDVLSGTNVSSLKELNNELINMKVSFTSAATGAKNLDAVWDEFINSTKRFDLSGITNSADRITAIVNELRTAKDVMYGNKAFQSANGYGTEEMLSWLNSVEQASKKMGVYRQEEVNLERQLADTVVQSEKKKQDAIKQTQDVKASQNNKNSSDNSLANEKRLLEFDAKRKKILQEIATYLSQNSKLTASNTKEAKELQANFQKIRQELQNIGRGDNIGLSTLSKQLTTAKLKTKELGLEGSSMIEKLGKLFNRFNSWFSVGQFSFVISNKIRLAVREIKELDTILTEISKTSDLTTSQLNELGDSAFDTASKYGKKASDYLTGVQEMYRAGYDNAKEMAELSVLAQSAGSMDSTTANDYLIATDAAYELKGNVEALNEVLDGQNYVTNNAAVSMDDMASATSEAASIAAQYGIEVNELSSLIAVAASKTRESGSEVGTALKSIFVNLQDTTNSSIVKAFETAGVSMTEMVNGSEKLKTPIALLKELSDVFTSLEEGSTVRATILNDIGGKYHANTLSAILSDWSSYEKMMDLYSQGEGSAFNESQKSAQNLEAALNRINNTITDIVNNVTSSKFLTDSANGLNEILSLINQLTDKLGALGTISVVGAGIVGANRKSSLNLTNMIAQYKDLSGAVTRYNALTTKAGFTAEKFNLAMQNNNTTMGAYLKSLNGAKASFGGYIQHLGVAKVSTIALSAATTAMNMALSMGTAFLISSAITALSEWANKAEKAKEALEESVSAFEETTSEVESLEEELKTCAEKIEDLQKLADSGTISVADEDELETLKKTNDELERKLALKKAEQIEEQEKVLNDNEDVLNDTFASKYKTFHRASGAQQVEEAAPVTVPEELGYALDEFGKLNYLLEQGSITQEEYNERIKEVKQEITDYSETVNTSVDAYDKLIAAGVTLQGEDLTLYNTLKDLQDRYLLYNYTLYGTAEAYKALSDEQKKKIILDKLEQQGLSENDAEEVYNTMSDEQRDDFYEIDFKFKEPNEADYKTASEYGKAYVQAMYGSAKQEADKSDVEISTISFADALSSEDYEDISKELTKLAEAGELTPNTLTSTKEYNQLLKDTNTTAQEACEQLYNMIDANERLATFSSNMGNVDKAYAEFKTNGYNTMDTLSGMQSAFGDLSYYDKFIQIAGNAKSSTEEIQQAYNKLVSEYVYSIGILDTVNESNKGMIQTQLEQLGITNAEEIVTQALSGDIMTLTNAKAILAQYSLNLESVTRSELDALVKEGKLSNETANQIATLALKKQACNLNTITTNGDIQNLAALAGVGTKAAQILNKIAEIKRNLANGDGAPAAAMQSTLDRLYADLKKELNKGTSVNFTTDYSGGTATTDAIDKANKEATKSTTKFSQAIDWCAQTLSKLSKTIDLYSAKLESNTNSVKTQIKYYKQLLNAQNNIIKGYAKTESKYKSTYTKALKKLSKSDQKKVKDGTYTIEQFSGKAKSGSTSKAEKRYNNIQAALEARDNYLDAQTDSVNAKNQLQEYAEALAAVRWDKATEQAEKLSEKVSVLDTKMSNVSGYKAKNKVLEEQLTLQKQILTKQENAYKNTESDANAYYKKISSKYKKNKNSDGTIKTSGVTNQTQLKYIKIYNAYVRQLADETVELAQAQEDYTAAVQEVAITRAENIKADYDNKLALIDAKANELDNQIALAEAKGQVASVEYYKQLGQNSDQRMTQLKGEKTQLESQLATLRPYSDEWYEVKQAVIEVDEEIANETVNAVENINKQIEAMDELTNKKNDYITHVSDSLSWFEGLVDEEDMYDDDGNFTDKGLAVLQSKLGRIEASRVRQENALKRIQELDEQYEQGLITEAQYLTARNEWEQQYQDEISTTADIQDELNDITKKGLEMQSDALSELIEKKKKMIDLDQSEYDYQKSIAEKTKNITDLQKQLAMLEGDNSEEGKAQRQKLEVELKDAQEDLADTQYEKYVERLEDALDDLQDRFDALIEKLDNLSGEEAEKQAYKTVEGNEANVEKGKEEVLSDAGAGTEFLNKDTDSLFSGSADDIGKKLDIANDYAEKTFNATVDGNDGTADLEVTLEEALGKVDLNNQKKYLAGDAKNKSALNQYLMSQGYNAMSENDMLGLTSAILGSKYASGIDENTRKELESISTVDQIDSDKKNAMLKGLKYVKAKEFIDTHATKATKEKSEYGTLNKKIYDITGGKVLSKADTVKLGSIFNVKDTNNNGAINGDEAKKLVKLLENAGFSNGGIVDVVRRNGDDGLAALKVGEAVLTPVQTTALMELAGKLQPLNNFMDVIQKPNLPTVQSSVGATNTIESINVELNLPNVTDKESFMKMVKSESDVQRMLQNIGFGGVMGSNKKFNVYKL